MKQVHIRNSERIEDCVNVINKINEQIEKLNKRKEKELEYIIQTLPFSTLKDREWIYDFINAQKEGNNL